MVYVTSRYEIDHIRKMNIALPSAIPIPLHSFPETSSAPVCTPSLMNSVHNDRGCSPISILANSMESLPCVPIGCTIPSSPHQPSSNHSQVLALKQHLTEKMMMTRRLSIDRVVEGCSGFVLFYQPSSNPSPQFYSIEPHYSREELEAFGNKSSQSYSNYLRYRAASLLALPSAYFAYFASLSPTTSSLYTINCKKQVEIPFGGEIADQANRTAALAFRHQLDIPYLEVS